METMNGVSKPVERNKLGRFLPGHKSIGGRRRGSRNLLSERFLTDLHAQCKQLQSRLAVAVEALRAAAKSPWVEVDLARVNPFAKEDS